MPSSLNEVVFDTTVVSVRQAITRQALAELYDVEVFMEDHAEKMVVQIERKVAADFKENIYWMVGYPASWWQHFKRDVLIPLTANPSTWLGRWLFEQACKVNLERKEFERDVWTRICPHLEIPANKPGPHVIWLKSDTVDK